MSLAGSAPLPHGTDSDPPEECGIPRSLRLQRQLCGSPAPRRGPSLWLVFGTCEVRAGLGGGAFLSQYLNMPYEAGSSIITAILCGGFGCLAATVIVLVVTYKRERMKEAQDRQLLLRAVRS